MLGDILYMSDVNREQLKRAGNVLNRSNDLIFTSSIINFFSKLNSLSRIEISLFVGLFLSIFLFTIFDLETDLIIGNNFYHILVDFTLSSISLTTVSYIAFSVASSRSNTDNQLNNFKKENATTSAEAKNWQNKVAQLKNGISLEIDHKMKEWNFTDAEKEVALLLLKGLSLKEIAEIRQTSERTVRHQSMAIYSKSNVQGRAELSAYFLEDFLDR